MPISRSTATMKGISLAKPETQSIRLINAVIWRHVPSLQMLLGAVLGAVGIAVDREHLDAALLQALDEGRAPHPLPVGVAEGAVEHLLRLPAPAPQVVQVERQVARIPAELRRGPQPDRGHGRGGAARRL